MPIGFLSAMGICLIKQQYVDPPTHRGNTTAQSAGDCALWLLSKPSTCSASSHSSFKQTLSAETRILLVRSDWRLCPCYLIIFHIWSNSTSHRILQGYHITMTFMSSARFLSSPSSPDPWRCILVIFFAPIPTLLLSFQELIITCISCSQTTSYSPFLNKILITTFDKRQNTFYLALGMIR